MTSGFKWACKVWDPPCSIFKQMLKKAVNIEHICALNVCSRRRNICVAIKYMQCSAVMHETWQASFCGHLEGSTADSPLGICCLLFIPLGGAQELIREVSTDPVKKKKEENHFFFRQKTLNEMWSVQFSLKSCINLNLAVELSSALCTAGQIIQLFSP